MFLDLSGLAPIVVYLPRHIVDPSRLTPYGLGPSRLAPIVADLPRHIVGLSRLTPYVVGPSRLAPYILGSSGLTACLSSLTACILGSPNLTECSPSLTAYILGPSSLTAYILGPSRPTPYILGPSSPTPYIVSPSRLTSNVLEANPKSTTGSNTEKQKLVSFLSRAVHDSRSNPVGFYSGPKLPQSNVPGIGNVSMTLGFCSRQDATLPTRLVCYCAYAHACALWLAQCLKHDGGRDFCMNDDPNPNLIMHPPGQAGCGHFTCGNCPEVCVTAYSNTTSIHKPLDSCCT
jgi:hypothetical protein